MEGIKYVKLMEIGEVVIEIQGVENGDLVVPIYNTLACCTPFLATDTWPCVLIDINMHTQLLLGYSLLQAQIFT